MVSTGAGASDAAAVGGGWQDGGGVPGDAPRGAGGGVRARLPLAHAVRGHGQVHPPLQLPVEFWPAFPSFPFVPCVCYWSYAAEEI